MAQYSEARFTRLGIEFTDQVTVMSTTFDPCPLPLFPLFSIAETSLLEHPDCLCCSLLYLIIVDVRIFSWSFVTRSQYCASVDINRFMKWKWSRVTTTDSGFRNEIHARKRVTLSLAHSLCTMVSIHRSSINTHKLNRKERNYHVLKTTTGTVESLVTFLTHFPYHPPPPRPPFLKFP